MNVWMHETGTANLTGYGRYIFTTVKQMNGWKSGRIIEWMNERINEYNIYIIQKN